MNQVIEALHHNLDSIRQYKIQKLAIFGSYARNEQNQESDIDVLVSFKEGSATFRNFMGLKLYLEGVLGHEVDLVSENAIKKDLLPYIMKDVIYVEGL